MNKQLKNRFIEEWSGWDWLGKMNVGGDYMPPEYMIFGKKYENMVPVGGPDGVAVMKPYRAGGEGGYEPDYKTIGLTANSQLAVLDYISYSQAQQMFCPESFAVELDGRLHKVEDTLIDKQDTITKDSDLPVRRINFYNEEGKSLFVTYNVLDQITKQIAGKQERLPDYVEGMYLKVENGVLVWAVGGGATPTTYIKDQQASGNTLIWHDQDGVLHNWTPSSQGGITGINLNGEAVSVKEGVAEIENVARTTDLNSKQDKTYIHTVEFWYEGDWKIWCRTINTNPNQYANKDEFFQDTRKIVSFFATKPNDIDPYKNMLQLGSMGAKGSIMTIGFENGFIRDYNITSSQSENFIDWGVEPL